MKKTTPLLLFPVIIAWLILASCTRNSDTVESQESKSKADEKPPTVNFEFPDEAVDK